MKHLMIIAILASFFSVSAFAEGQTSTECPMIAQARRAANAKLEALSKSAEKPVQISNAKVEKL